MYIYTWWFPEGPLVDGVFFILVKAAVCFPNGKELLWNPIYPVTNGPQKSWWDGHIKKGPLKKKITDGAFGRPVIMR